MESAATKARRIRRVARVQPARKTIKQAATELGVTVQALYKAAGEGRITVHRAGRRVFISEAENVQYFADLRAVREALAESQEVGA